MLWSLESLWGCCTPSKPQQRPAPHSRLSWAPGTSCLCCSCGARPDLLLASHPCPCSLSQELLLPRLVAAKGLVGAMVSPAPWQRTSARAVRDTGGLGLPTWMHWVSLSQLLPWLPKELPYPLQEAECSPTGPQARRALCRMRKPAWPAGRVISHSDSLQIPLFLPHVHPHVPQLQGYPGWVAVFHQGDLRGRPRHTGGSQRRLPAELRAQGMLPAEAAHSPGRKGRAKGLGLPQLPSPFPATAYQQPRFPLVPVQPSQGANQTPLFTCSPHAVAFGFPGRNMGWLTEALVLSA